MNECTECDGCVIDLSFSRFLRRAQRNRKEELSKEQAWNE